jgi:hypothetical protein
MRQLKNTFMTERTMILNNYSVNVTSTLPKNWIGELFGSLGRKFDALATLVAKWSNI